MNTSIHVPIGERERESERERERERKRAEGLVHYQGCVLEHHLLVHDDV